MVVPHTRRSTSLEPRRYSQAWLAFVCVLGAACGRSTLSTQPLGEGGTGNVGRADGGGDAGFLACLSSLGTVYGDPAQVIGERIIEDTTVGGSQLLSSDCGGAGPEQVVTFVPAFSGLVFFNALGAVQPPLLYTLEDSDLGICSVSHINSDCVLSSSTSPENELSMFVTDGVPVHLVVDSLDAGGPFTLDVRYTLFPPEPEQDCSDGMDNDFDGVADCDDLDCNASPVCNVAGCLSVTDIGSDVGTYTGNTRAASNTLSASCGGASAAEDVWAWTAPETARYVFDTAGSDFDTVLYAAETVDGCTPGVELACNDDDGATRASRLELELEAGQAILLAVDGFASESGAYELHIEPADGIEDCGNGVDDDGDGAIDCGDPSCAANPQCTGACPAGEANAVGATEGSTTGRSDTFTSPCNAEPDGLDTALEWTAPHDGPFQFDTLGSEFDTVLSIYDGSDACVGEGRGIVCNDDTVQLWSQVQLEAVAGETYLVVVDGYSSDAFGPFVLNVTDLAPLDTETDCDDGLDDDGDGQTDCSDDDCAADDACVVSNPETRCGNGIDDDGDGAIDCEDSDCASRNVCQAEVRCDDGRDNDADGATDCDDSDCAGEASCLPRTESRCEDGRDDDGDGAIDCDDDDCAADPACLVQTDCFDADLGQSLGLSVSRGTTLGATNASGSACGGQSAPDVVLRWTAPRAGSYQFDTFGSQYDTVLYLWTDTSTCAPLEIACNDDSRQVLQSLVTWDLSAGEAVYVVVDGYDNQSGNYNLNVRELAPTSAVERDCFNGIDDDNDGTVDCGDPDCTDACTF